jgi:hypothetical protein
MVVAEDLHAFTLEKVLASPVTEFLRTQEFEPCAKMHHSVIYLAREYISGDNIAWNG